MKSAVLIFAILLTGEMASVAQVSSTGLKTAEFVSPTYERTKNGQQAMEQYCFSFITERFSGGDGADICYGGLRAGNEWDWFQVMGEGTRNNLKNLGAHRWKDDFKLAVVDPYPKLKAGETRSIKVSTAGRDGFSPTPRPVPMLSKNTGVTSEQKALPYKAYFEAGRGNIYALRVVDDKSDFYVLFRVDELERGKRCKISWKRIEAPQEN